MKLRNSSGVPHVDSVTDLQIVVDSREQRPLWESQRRKLEVGDYTTVKLERRFAIERKSPGDLYQTITRGHSRFRREMERAKDNGIKLVVYVECSKFDFIDKTFEGGDRFKYPSSGLRKIIWALSHKHKLEFVWCRNREELLEAVIERLRYEETKVKPWKR